MLLCTATTEESGLDQLDKDIMMIEQVADTERGEQVWFGYFISSCVYMCE